MGPVDFESSGSLAILRNQKERRAFVPQRAVCTIQSSDGLAGPGLDCVTLESLSAACSPPLLPGFGRLSTQLLPTERQQVIVSLQRLREQSLEKPSHSTLIVQWEPDKADFLLKGLRAALGPGCPPCEMTFTLQNALSWKRKGGLK